MYNTLVYDNKVSVYPLDDPEKYHYIFISLDKHWYHSAEIIAEPHCYYYWEPLKDRDNIVIFSKWYPTTKKFMIEHAAGQVFAFESFESVMRYLKSVGRW